ncbi:MAG: DUF4912 domain-containing protein [Clostridia bacterium]|nr:DUF4912 domain-containing protein [Clostridium sp.]
MPRKTKETDEIKNNITLHNASKKTKTSSKNTTKSKTTSSSTLKNKNLSNDKKKNTANTLKNKNTKSKNIKNKKLTSPSLNSYSTQNKTVNNVNLKNSISKTSKNKKTNIIEYYDLPYRYNQTVVKVLAQTPNNLFIYWDISDKDRDNYKKQYGENFFENTKPILIVHNDTLNYTFEVDINDFANSWYLHINDSKCDYRIELGRRPITKLEKNENTDYIYISSSNEIESPNDHVLFNKNQNMVYFKNTKTGTVTNKKISANISFMRNMGKIYNISDLYKAIYKDENIEDIFDLSNPSSGNPSSGFSSSQFK